jgi:hypothetical protein
MNRNLCNYSKYLNLSKGKATTYCIKINTIQKSKIKSDRESLIFVLRKIK